MNAVVSKDLVASVSVRTFDEAAFVFTERVDQAPPFGPGVMEASIRFSGPRSGQVSLTGTARLGAVLAANLLGVEPDDPEVMGRSRDAIGEMLNIITGALLREIFGPEAICPFKTPVVTELDAEAQPQGPQCEARALLVTDDGERIDVAIAFSS